MQYSENYYKTKDKKKLFIRSWFPSDHTSLMVIFLHDIGEHSGRYESWAKQFIDNDIAVYAMDIRGHGKSEGKRGHVDNFDVLLKDIKLLISNVEKEHPNLPILIYGQGLGGNLALYYGLNKKANVDGLIITSPWLRSSRKVNDKHGLYLSFVGKYLPKISLKYIRPTSNLTNDATILKNYFSDPLSHNKITVKTLNTIEESGNVITSRKYKINLPVLLMHGTSDNLTSSNETLKFGENSSNMEVKIWKGKYHELHTDINKTEVFEFIKKWIDSNVQIPSL